LTISCDSSRTWKSAVVGSCIFAVGTAVLHHSDKGRIHGDLDELLKDANVLQHYLYNTSLELDGRVPARLVRILDEMGVEQAL